MGKAKLTPTSIDIIKSIKDMEKKQAGRTRADFAGVSAVATSVGIAAGGAGSSATNAGGLPTSGGTMIGPIAFFPVTLTVATGVVDIGLTSSAYTSYIICIGEGGSSDTITTIDNPNHSGQLLYLQAHTTTPITLAHGTGNIWDFNGNDYEMTSGEIVILVWDAVNTRWVLTASFGGSGAGGITFPITPTLLALSDTWTGTQTINLSLTTAHVTKITLDQNLTIDFSNPPTTGTQIEFEVEYLQDGTGGRTVTHVQTIDPTPIIRTGGGNTTLVTYRTNDGGSNYSSVSASGVTANFSFLSNIVEDLSPELGADLDVKTFDITNIDTLVFDQAAGAAFGTTRTGIKSSSTSDLASWVPLASKFQWFEAGTIQMQLSATGGLTTLQVSDSLASALELGETTGSTVGTITKGTASMEYVDPTLHSFLVGVTPMLQLTIEGLDYAEITKPTAPAANFGRVYAKLVTDHSELFYQDELGTETNLTAGGGANTTLSNLGSTAVNDDIDPATDASGESLGTASKRWLNIYGSVGVYNTLSASTSFSSLGTTILGDATGDDISFVGRMATDIDPKTDASGQSLGSASLRWLNIHGSVGVFNTLTATTSLSVTGTTTLGDAVTDAVNFVGDVQTNISIDAGGVVKSADSQEIGFQVTDATLTVGSVGSIETPLTSTVTTTKATLDGLYGNTAGCMGILDSGSGSLTLWVRQTDANWAAVTLTRDQGT